MPASNLLPEAELQYASATAAKILPPSFQEAYQEVAVFDGVSSAGLDYFVHPLVKVPRIHVPVAL